MKSRAGSLGYLWRSVGFRLTFYFGFLVTITMIATVFIIYMQTVGVLYQGMTRQVAGVSQTLTVRFESGGAPALIQEIERELSDDQNVASEILLYVDPRGAKLAGNLDTLPPTMDHLGDGFHRLVMRGGIQVSAYVVVRRMADGSQLFVGNDLRDQVAMDALVTRGIAMASVVAVIFLTIGFVVFRQQLDRSVGAIRQTLSRVASGELKDRVVSPGQEDEFALLGNDINSMLDRIEVLMAGVRHVSDTIAHNLRTPLTRILLRLRAATEYAAPGSVQKKNMDDAVLDIEELISVFEKLLNIAEAEAGARRIDFRPVALSSIVREVLDFYEVVAELQGTVLVGDVSADIVVMGDPDLLAGALSNLVDNALKYGGPGTRVEITQEMAPHHVRVTVKDNGTGIPAADLKQLGTRFFRHNRTVSGHGLGVASVAAVVSLHGGRIRFEDATPGLAVCMEFPRPH